MPTFTAREAGQVPPARKTLSRAARQQQDLYEGFLKSVGAWEVGDLDLTPGETTRGVRMRLHRAATRLGLTVNVWDADEHVYFQL